MYKGKADSTFCTNIGHKYSKSKIIIKFLFFDSSKFPSNFLEFYTVHFLDSCCVSLDNAHKYVIYNEFVNPSGEKTRFPPSFPNKL